MYDEIVANIRTCSSLTNDFFFLIKIELHQGSVSSVLSVIVINELTRAIQDEIIWCILFTGDIVLVDEMKAVINTKLEL